MVNGNRRKRLKISSDFSEEDSADVEEVAEFDANPSSDSDFESTPTNSSTRILSAPTHPPIISVGTPSCQAWIEKFSDISKQGGLVTSNRKSKEILTWLRGAFQRSRPRLLVLTGPPGSGKSSALRAAAKELQCTVVSWQAPATGERYISMTLLEDFQSFFIGSRYQTLEYEDEEHATGTGYHDRRVLLVEDLPISISDSIEKRDMIQKILDDAARFAPYPTVLVLSDSEKGVARSAKFFLGQELLSSPNVEGIKVPAVTEAMMRRRLGEVLQKQGISVSRQQLEGTLASSNGDVRAAVNALQFCLSGETPEEDAKQKQLQSRELRRPTNKRRRSILNSLQLFPALNFVNQDETLGTYHAVSKILNNKRREDGLSKYVPEDILEHAKADPSSFLAFLHHNYPEYFGDIDDVVPALECLCEADCLLPWMQDDLARTALGDCAASVASRGFLLHNCHPIRTGWRPIRGPESFAIAKEGRAHIENARRQFAGILSPSIFTTSTMCETVPFAERITGCSLKEWGLARNSGIWIKNAVADSADVAMVDMEVAKENETIKDNIIANKPNEVQARQDGEMEDIEEWDD